MARKKPTMKEVTEVIGQIINQTEILKKRATALETVLSEYIAYKKDDKKFKGYMDKRAEEIAKDRTGDSVRDDKQQKVSKSG